jgi:hypothetical protein
MLIVVVDTDRVIEDMSLKTEDMLVMRHFT